MIPRSILVAALALTSSVAHAWGATGHMVIAALAKREMTPYALSEANRLLKIGGDTRTNEFLTAAVWADDVRRDRPDTGNWHYINLHFRTDHGRVTNKPEKENVVEAIDRFRKVLADKTKPDADRAEALRFLMHFVGDIHQPLHAVARDSVQHPQGDRGGNDFQIRPPASMAGDSYAPKNLHSLWDGGAGLFPYFDRPLSPADRTAIEREAELMEATLPIEEQRGAKNLDPMTWAKESLDAAKRVTYDLNEGAVPSEDYMRRSRRVCAQRAALAAYRLAAILNECLR